ncbi:ABC transporter ATP-binding protein [Catenulispora pinisilvae]|uniref:ABC transporter ATP-binding protein n=1 Tax=Catenulispora pinisilvae TaxID=2705253 RepID=UPI001891C74C|nr:ABC transporter ATP-binding protein [Catenulispora pinisilvae]
MTAPNVTITGLTVTFRRGQVRALDGVNLRLPTGMVGLLGPNGAGKTTFMRVLTGVLQPASGTVSVDGTDLTSRAQRREVKAATGYLPQELGLYPDLTARQFLDYMALLKGITDKRARRDRVHEVLRLVALDDVARRKLKTYSGGMKRRVGIAQAILNDPRLLIVDEPTVGLDPEERLRFRSLLATLSGDRTVLLSTHIVDDIVQTCPNVVVIEHGGIAFEGAIGELAARAEGMVWQLTQPATTPPPDLPTVTISPGISGTVYRVVSSSAPTPDAESVSATVEDGYIALMHAIDSTVSERSQRTQRSERSERSEPSTPDVHAI